MNNGHGVKKALIPLVQTVFLSGKSMGVKEIESFSATAFVDDITYENDRILLEGKYEIHFDYYGTEGEKLYRDKARLPLRAELSSDWKYINGESIDLKIECGKLQVLAPYVLEFGGNAIIGLVENNNKSQNINNKENFNSVFLRNKAEQLVKSDRESIKKQAESVFKPDPIIEKILSEYENGGLDDVFWKKDMADIKDIKDMKNIKNAKSMKGMNSITETKDVVSVKPISDKATSNKTVSDDDKQPETVDLKEYRSLFKTEGKETEFERQIGNKNLQNKYEKNAENNNLFGWRQKNTTGVQPFTVAENKSVDLTDLKNRTLDKLKESNSVNNNRVKNVVAEKALYSSQENTVAETATYLKDEVANDNPTKKVPDKSENVLSDNVQGDLPVAVVSEAAETKEVSAENNENKLPKVSNENNENNESNEKYEKPKNDLILPVATENAEPLEKTLENISENKIEVLAADDKTSEIISVKATSVEFGSMENTLETVENVAENTVNDYNAESAENANTVAEETADNNFSAEYSAVLTENSLAESAEPVVAKENIENAVDSTEITKAEQGEEGNTESAEISHSVIAENNETADTHGGITVENNRIVSGSGLVVELQMQYESENGFALPVSAEGENAFYLKYTMNNSSVAEITENI